jgi:type I restriction enzyme S subunit
MDWLDVLPEHWTTVRFKYVCRERDARSTDGSETLLSVSAYTGVSPRSELVAEGEHLSRAESLEGYKICRKNDLVMNIMLAWSRGLGVTKFDGIVSPAYCVFQLGTEVDPAFFDYLVRSDELITYFKRFSAGVIDSRLRLYPDAFGSLFCIRPPLPEQRAIAAFLDSETGKIDTLVAEQRRLIELLKEKRQAVISHAVTKGLNPEVLPAKRVASVFVPQRNKPELNSEYAGVPWITMEAMGNGELYTSTLYVSESAAAVAGSRQLEPNAVIASCVGTFGVVAINRVPVIINQQLQAYLANDSIIPEYLRHCVNAGSSYFEMIGTAATLAYVNQQGFENFPLALPSLREQSEIVSHIALKIAWLDTLIAEAETAITLLQERRSALISAAVTGKIDVRGLVSAETEAA